MLTYLLINLLQHVDIKLLFTAKVIDHHAFRGLRMLSNLLQPGTLHTKFSEGFQCACNNAFLQPFRVIFTFCEF